MRILLLTALALFAAPTVAVFAQETEQEAKRLPSKEEVSSMLTQLKAAWKTKVADEKVTAITAAKEVLHKDVIKEIAKGLKDKEMAVRDAAIDALRWMDHPEALRSLSSVWSKDKDLRKDIEVAPRFLKAIGQHGAQSSLKLLTTKPMENVAPKAIQARIYAIGRIRSVKSIEALLDMVAKGGNGGGRGGRGGGGGRGGRNSNDYRVSLTVLTGADLGADMNIWKKWWSKNKKGYKMAAEVPTLPRDVERNWNKFWGLTEESDRGTEREDRGDGPEKSASSR